MIRMIRIKAAVPRRLLALGLPAAWSAPAITYQLTCPLAPSDSLGARAATSAVFLAAGTGLILHVRRALLRELRQLRRVAGAAQSVLLRPLPPRVDGLGVAAAQLSADRGARLGGDLYEVIPTEHGVRVVMGDVRGHGIAAVGTAAALLGSFREAAHDEPDLDRVLRRLERALDRHVRAHPREDRLPTEEFATVLLLEIGAQGGVRALNCGHPWPYLISGTRVEQLNGADPLPPLGIFPLPPDLSATWQGPLHPGETLALYTDGVEDARDEHGRFFSLQAALQGAVSRHAATPQLMLHTVLRALLHHAGGAPPDDVALLFLRNDRTRPLGARGTARPATTHPQPTTHL
ncbi:membrane protein [Streptomyces sp. NBRC 14336]|nr:membrane protein [Streptomyces sp. NBRC 14336]